MRVEATIEELENANDITYDTDFDCEVTLQGLSTNRAVPIIESCLPELDELIEIVHYRKRSSIFYRTIIKGLYFSIDVHSALGSGYGGEGPNGFYRVLQELGVDEEQAKVVFDSRYENAVITIKPMKN